MQFCIDPMSCRGLALGKGIIVKRWVPKPPKLAWDFSFCLQSQSRTSWQLRWDAKCCPLYLTNTLSSHPVFYSISFLSNLQSGRRRRVGKQGNRSGCPPLPICCLSQPIQLPSGWAGLSCLPESLKLKKPGNLPYMVIWLHYTKDPPICQVLQPISISVTFV